MYDSKLRLLRNILIFGVIGLLIEIMFTGIKSLAVGDWKAVGQTYLWMFPIYGVGGITLSLLRDSVRIASNRYANAALMALLIYVPIIFGMEFLAGWTLLKVIGTVPWQYGPGTFTVMGLIRLDYAPFWFLLALLFEPIAVYLNKLNLLPKDL